MFTGNNTSGKEFDTIDEDGDVLGSFDNIGDALACAKAAPWWAGKAQIRRDRATVARRHAETMRLRAEARTAFLAFCCDF